MTHKFILVAKSFVLNLAAHHDHDKTYDKD